MLNVCVFCSSSNQLGAAYFDEARLLGELIAQRGWGLVYGGTRIGLMGQVARAVLENGGSVTGVIPELILSKGIQEKNCTQLIVTADMSQRKKLMIEKSDVFVALPGGFGTLEEMMEVITLKQLQILDKPVVFLNTLNFYQHLNHFFDTIFEQQFTASKFRNLFHIAPDAHNLFHYLDNYVPAQVSDKWSD